MILIFFILLVYSLLITPLTCSSLYCCIQRISDFNYKSPLIHYTIIYIYRLQYNWNQKNKPDLLFLIIDPMVSSIKDWTLISDYLEGTQVHHRIISSFNTIETSEAWAQDVTQ